MTNQTVDLYLANFYSLRSYLYTIALIHVLCMKIFSKIQNFYHVEVVENEE